MTDEDFSKELLELFNNHKKAIENIQQKKESDGWTVENLLIELNHNASFNNSLLAALIGKINNLHIDLVTSKLNKLK